MTKPRRVIWCGCRYTLETKRHWNYFFDYALKFEVRSGLKSTFPKGNVQHMLMFYDKVETLENRFRNFDDWWSFSRKVCDDYCEHFLLGNGSDQNLFKRAKPSLESWLPPNYHGELEALAKTFPSFDCDSHVDNK